MLKKNLLIFSLIIFLLLSSNVIFAEDLKMVYITMERVLEEYKYYNDEIVRINDEIADKEAVIQEKLNEYQMQLDELQNKILSPLASEEAKQAAYEEYNQLMNEAYQYRDEQLSNLDIWSQQELEPVYTKIYLKVEEIAVKEDYDFVFNESSTLVYCDIKHDVTDRVIKELNAEYKPEEQ